MKRYILLETIAIGYILLLLVLLSWANMPVTGILLALILECPVAGYYLHVMRHQIESAETHQKWHDVPSWSRNLIELFKDGFQGNVILVAYYAAMALVFAIPYIPLRVFAFYLAALEIVQVPHLIVIGASLLISLIPLLWIHYLLCPLALARFAHTGRLADAFDLKTLSKLAWTNCKFAWQAAIIFLIFNLINMAVTMGAPNLIVLIVEPSIEFTSLVIVYKKIAKSYSKQMDFLLDVPPVSISAQTAQKNPEKEKDNPDETRG